MNHPNAQTTLPIPALDVMRGLALLGMLISQIQTYPLLASLSLNSVVGLPLEQADRYTTTQFFIALLVNGPSESLFSIGFGWSFHQLWQGGQQSGLDAGRIARRQLGALLGLGLLHGLVGWFGDLLHGYALLGFSLLYFTRQSVLTLLRWIGGLTALVVLAQLIQAPGFSGFPPGLAAGARQLDALLSGLIHPGQTGSFRQLPALRPTGWLMGLTPYGNIQIMLLIGLVLGKRWRLDRRAELRVQLSLLIVLVFPLAILLKGVASLWVVEVVLLPARWQAYETRLASLCELAGTLLLTLVYLLEIGLNVTQLWRPVGSWVGQVGRMSLTAYLMQSALSRLVFCAVRWGLPGPLSLPAEIGIVVVVYGFGLWFSHWWLSRHPQGPLEGLLTRWSYGKAGSTLLAARSLL